MPEKPSIVKLLYHVLVVVVTAIIVIFAMGNPEENPSTAFVFGAFSGAVTMAVFQWMDR